MKWKSSLTLILCLLCYLSGRSQIDSILDRYRENLFKTEKPSDIHALITSLSDQGTWADIDYGNADRADWKTLTHLKRVQDMALSWSNPKSTWYHQNILWKGINKSFDYWLYHRLYNPNWWYNEIGVPQYIQNILILLHNHLSKYERIRGMEELNQYRLNGTGTNLIWSAELGFHYGALAGDSLLMRHCIDTIIHEIKITTHEGIQPDYSFHMHGKRLQIFSYGSAFLKETIKLAIECKGTAWAFPEKSIDVLVNFVLNGCQWMCRGINTAPGTIDRSISREGALHAADIRGLIPELAELCPQRRQDLMAFDRRQNGTGKPLIGFRYFPYSDFAAYQRQSFSFFLKTISTRTDPSESINGENLKGHLLNSGDAYLIRDGSEYNDLMPVWNWDKLPGITSFDGAENIVRKSFVGSISDGISGLTAMDYEMEAKDTLQNIRAHKIWAVHNGLVVCLISALEKGSLVQSNIFTVLDQCRLQGDVIVNNISEKIDEGTHLLTNVKWIYHNGFSYIPVKPATIRLQTGIARGTWKSISASASDSVVIDSVFMPVMLHDPDSQNRSTGYVLAYSGTAEKTAYLASHPSWRIWRNDDSCQVVQFRDGTLMVAFFSPGVISNDQQFRVGVNRPCLILVSPKKQGKPSRIQVSDPLHEGGIIRITMNHIRKEVTLPSDGTTTFFLESDL